jgi:hypothetical protein
VTRRMARWWRELRWFVRCVRKGYPLKVYRTISPHQAPPATLERLRVRILTGNWGDPLTDADYEEARRVLTTDGSAKEPVDPIDGRHQDSGSVVGDSPKEQG